MKHIKEEAIQLFDRGGDYRSFDEIYAGKEDLFEGVDDIIDPKMKKLFEETYQVGNVQQKRLREASISGSDDEVEEIKKAILAEVPLKTKKELRELLKQSTIEDAFKAVLEGFGVESEADAEDLSTQEQQGLAASILVLACLQEDKELLKTILKQQNLLMEAKYEPTYTKYKDQKHVSPQYATNPEKKIGWGPHNHEYPYFKTNDKGEVYYLSGEKVTKNMLEKMKDKIVDIGMSIGPILAAVGTIGLIIAAAVAPIMILAHNICRLALTNYGGQVLFGLGGDRAGTARNVVGIIVAALLMVGGGGGAKAKMSEARRRVREAGADGKPEMVGDSRDEFNFSGDEGKPSGDGICDGHNRAGLGGSDPCATQGQGRGSSSNSKLFNESFEALYNKTHMKEADMYECDKCGEPVSYDDAIEDPQGGILCPDCANFYDDFEFMDESKKSINKRNRIKESDFDDDYDQNEIEDVIYKYAIMNDFPDEEVAQIVREQFPGVDAFLEEYGSAHGFSVEEMIEGVKEDGDAMNAFDDLD